MKTRKNIFFDMDWTLYQFPDSEWYSGSLLSKEVKKNLEKILARFKISDRDLFIQEAKDRNISYSTLAVEKFWISYNEYYNQVRDISPKNRVKVIEDVKEIVKSLKDKGLNVYILSDAPMVWISNVLTMLDIKDCFMEVYSGVWEINKEKWWLYELIPQTIRNNEGHFPDKHAIYLGSIPHYDYFLNKSECVPVRIKNKVSSSDL